MGTRARLLVTGHHGFVGQALQHWLPQSQWAAQYQLVLPTGRPDVRDAHAMSQLVQHTSPDAVLHLAAQSFVPAAFADPANTLQVNLGGTLNLLQALDKHGFKGRFLFVSSADVYGAVPEHELPVDETRLPMPRNPYAVSKAAAELLCRQWHFAHGLDACIARPFNHTGAGQDPRFVLSGFAQRIAQMSSGKTKREFVTGNLDVTRDFTDVRDVLDAYFFLLEDGVSGETYNVCSGHERRIRDLLDTMLRMAGVTAEVRTDSALLRPNEQTRMQGSYGKLHQHTGWKPQCSLEDTLATLINWWQDKEAKS